MDGVTGAPARAPVVERSSRQGRQAGTAEGLRHPRQPRRGYSWTNAGNLSILRSPEYDAGSERGRANLTRGHIVFVDSNAGRRWVKEMRVASAIGADRIGVLNTEVSPNASDSERIAREFRGDPAPRRSRAASATPS